MEKLLEDIKNCEVCKAFLSHGINPVVRASVYSKLIIIGQAPGRKVHETGIPWNDESGKRLRLWLNISLEDFYNPQKVALIPMGFCFPGKDKKGGDLPPRPECAPLWHPKLFKNINHNQLTLLVGSYAQKFYLKERFKENVTETIKSFEEYLPNFFPLPHPSPRNNLWLRKNPWFEAQVLPVLASFISKNI